MPANLSQYASPILAACVAFPFIAALFTLPFMILNYRRYGGIALMRVLVVYSFILYSMCAFLLTVMPLPTRASVAASAPRPISWIPLTDLVTGLKRCGILSGSAASLFSPALWLKYLKSSDLFQIVANIVMLIPLGFYLRYYFRFSMKKAVLTGLCVSLFYELTQLTGLWFIYAHAYRLASVDDLINNTLGCWIGYLTAPLLMRLLPSREEIDRISYRKGEQLTLIRRAVAALLDFLVLETVSFAEYNLLRALSGSGDPSVPRLGMLNFLIYFVAIPYFSRGRTPGQAILKVRVVCTGTSDRPGIGALLVRNFLLYVVEPFLMLIIVCACGGIAVVLTAEGIDRMVMLILLGGAFGVIGAVLLFFLRCRMKWNAFPHGYLSHTEVVLG